MLSSEHGADNRPLAIFLMGPTAAGKTDLAVHLSEHADCDIISVDSALIYKGMDIGSAKPDAETLARAPHRLIDICDPAESYSAAQFRDDALAEMDKIIRAGKTPLLTGGTMMYYKRLYDGVADLPSADTDVRARLDDWAEKEGLEALHRRLQEIDPVSALRIHQNDPQRLQRALEVYEITGKSLTEHWQAQQQCRENFPFRVLSLAVCPEERKDLHARIALRYELMLKQGFISEVESLRARGDLNLSMPSMRSVGYRQVWEYLDGIYDYETMVHKGIVATRQLAKRQITWLRSWPDLHWLKTEAKDLPGQVLKKIESALI
ncbi:tRNA (adenosine(37)-N6)-dimethylallyltransferase MiaA [Oceanospirillum sediminis]|uniref:tRNA dimethylallyltransferase n=1 Tax=Oceanospirillum sediminis TaxID=2760088 RepID=A0A839IIL1_9GAMM|nr:tRNA (adenosine(37)-N6)-dimethylallyltransferase MiaA [Oceanospirillum sediminis]MBB1485005.1 tRNA (adenosine(37)-N6)-dimethylallyltransferase MiaA [Oceanospirillum sediminis]